MYVFSSTLRKETAGKIFTLRMGCTCWAVTLEKGIPIGYSAPLGIIEFRSAPSFLLQTCIVVLASIDTIKSDCTGRCPATEIGGNSLHASIGVGNAQVQTESGTVAPRGTVEVPHCFGLMVIPAITQKYANSVVTIL